MLSAADIFVAPYVDSSVSSSGTLSMAMACGLAPIATPFDYAKTVLQSGRGVFMRFRNSDSFKHAASYYLEHPGARKNAGARSAEFMRKMAWPAVGARYVQLFHPDG